MRWSIFRRFSWSVRGFCFDLPSSSHSSRSWPTVTPRRLTSLDSTSCTNAPSALAAARSEPTKVFVLRICFPVTES